MRRLSVVLLGAFAFAAALGTACQRSPDDLLFVVGRVVDAEGSPLEGVSVSLLRNGNADCHVTLYGNHIPDYDAGTYAPLGHFTSNQKGDFLFEYVERDTRADGERYQWPACLKVQADTAQGSVTVEFSPPDTSVELADLPLRHEPPTVREEGDALALHGGPAPDLRLYTASVRGWDVRAGEDLLWITEDVDGGSRIPTYVLEDYADVTLTHRNLGLFERKMARLSPIDAFYAYLMKSDSAPVRAVAPGVVPVSRGAACTPTVADGGACPLTDGELTPVDLGQMQGVGAGPPPSQLLVDLGEVRAVRSVVVRDLAVYIPVEELYVEGSEDGETWTRLGVLASGLNRERQGESGPMLRYARSPGYFFVLELSEAVPARLVRIDATPARQPEDPGDWPLPDITFQAVREVSVFE